MHCSCLPATENDKDPHKTSSYIKVPVQYNYNTIFVLFLDNKKIGLPWIQWWILNIGNVEFKFFFRYRVI